MIPGPGKAIPTSEPRLYHHIRQRFQLMRQPPSDIVENESMNMKFQRIVVFVTVIGFLALTMVALVTSK